MASDNLSLEELINFSEKRLLSAPFTLLIKGSEFECVEVLRVLPQRRIVLKVNTTSKETVVLKCFIANNKGKNDFQRELNAYGLVSKRGIQTPKLLEQIALETMHILVFEYLSIEKDIDNKSQYTFLFKFVAMMHQKGVYQKDLHFDNILFSKGKAWLIDLASVKYTHDGAALPYKVRLANLAILLAQYTLSERIKCLEMLAVYFDCSGMEYTSSVERDLSKLTDQVWKKRKRHFLNKQTRNCTDTTYYKDRTWLYAANREFWSEWQPESIDDISSLFSSSSELLKGGNTATVINTKISGKKVVIKRYNIKNFRHWLTRFWRPSRAYHSWINAHLLEFIGIKTPKPLAFIEKRQGWFRSTAYFICEYIEGYELLDYYQMHDPEDDEIKQLNMLFFLMKESLIGHGDMKAQNLIIDKQGTIYLIDLDAMKEFQISKKALTAHKKDVDRFFYNWRGDEHKKQLFSSLMDI